MADQVPDFNKLFKIAQQVATNMEPPPQLRKGKKNNVELDINGVFSHVAKNISKAMTPEIIEDMSGMGSITEVPDVSNSKVSLKSEKKKRVVEIESDDDSEEDPVNPRTKDMNFTLSITLEEAYKGAKKKLAIRRQKLNSEGKLEEEKKKLSIKIDPGVIDEQTVRFNHMADEKSGYETGDVVVSLDIEEHPEFVRDGNNLLIEKEISISDSFNPILYIKHINGKMLKVTGDPIDVFNEDDELKKICGLGMPISGEPGKFGDLFIRFKCVNDFKLTDEQITTLKTIFPSKIEVPNLEEEEVVEQVFEMVTESDLEFLEDSDSDESYEDSDSEESEEESD